MKQVLLVFTAMMVIPGIGAAQPSDQPNNSGVEFSFFRIKPFRSDWPLILVDPKVNPAGDVYSGLLVNFGPPWYSWTGGRSTHPTLELDSMLKFSVGELTVELGNAFSLTEIFTAQSFYSSTTSMPILRYRGAIGSDRLRLRLVLNWGLVNYTAGAMPGAPYTIPLNSQKPSVGIEWWPMDYLKIRTETRWLAWELPNFHRVGFRLPRHVSGVTIEIPGEWDSVLERIVTGNRNQ